MSKVASLIPLFNRVLVKRNIKDLHTSAKGIITQTSDKKGSTFVAEVLQVGSRAFKERDEKGTVTEWHKLEAGQKVLLTEYSGTKVEDLSNKESEVLLVKDSEIVAVVSKME